MVEHFLQTKWFRVRTELLSPQFQIWLKAQSSLTFRKTIECRSTLKLVRDMIITYYQTHRTNKYLQRSSVVWLVSLNGWVFLTGELITRFLTSPCFLKIPRRFVRHLNPSSGTFTMN